MTQKKIVLIANSDWNSFWFQRQEFASRFAKEDYMVVYINRSFQRFPKLFHVINRLFPSQKRGKVNNSIPKNLLVITPLWLTPFKWLQPFNKILVKFTYLKIKNFFGDTDNLFLITYLPTYPSLELINIIDPQKTAYINVHNYDDDKNVLKDLLMAEKELVKKVDVLYGDSQFNINRLYKLSNKRHIYCSPPGADSEHFRKAYRGDEAHQCQKIFFYGGIGNHLDMDLYEFLSKKYEVIFIGVVSPELERPLPKSIKVLPPVTNHELPELLKEADILSILYKGGGYVKAKLPAKFFECISTLKPLLVSGLDETELYPDCVYQVMGSADTALEIIKNLPITETNNRIEARKKVAMDYDWEHLFKEFNNNFFNSKS